MARRLTAIEIAEGALLADIGVIFQLLALYLPIGQVIFQILSPIVFAIIVLRRDFYVGIMSMCVALFTIGIMSGPGALPLMLLECSAGLYLGVTMKHRMGHFWLILLGTFSGTLVFYAVILAADFLTGIPLSDLVKGLHDTFNSFISLVGVIATSVGLGGFWQHTIFPFVNAIAQVAFTYWWIAFYVVNWLFVLPTVIVIYYIANLFARLLGHKVRQFPGKFIDNLWYRALRILSGLFPKRGKGEHWMGRALRREVRRLGIARQKAKP